MLNTLDTVIAFAVIMTVLSLLITIIVQMVSASFSLRGKNLANALALTFQTIDPKIGEHAHSLAAQILRDPILSDSIWQKKSRQALFSKLDSATQFLIDAEKRLKLAAIELAKHQDEATKPAKEQALTQAKEDVKIARSKAPIPTVRPNRMTQWGFWTWPGKGATQLATAIRPGEVYRILHKLAEMTETEAAVGDVPAGLVQASANLIAALRGNNFGVAESYRKLQAVAAISKHFPDSSQGAVVSSLADLGATVERTAIQAYDRFQRWFDSAQDRAEQWFQMHVRIVTVVGSVLLAFLLQLDTIEIFGRLRDRPELVDALVKSAPGLVEQGGKILDSADTTAHRAYLLWLEKHPAFELNPLPVDGTAKSYHDALQALLTKKAVQPSDAATWLAEYDALQSQTTQEFLQSRQESFTTLKANIQTAGFDLVPTHFLARWDKPNQPAGFSARLGQFWSHLFGVLVTASLLTLGAPFWFNVLKNLMNLRPAVASLVEKRPTTAPAALPTPPPSG